MAYNGLKFALRNTILLFILMCNLGCDQWSKAIARNELIEQAVVKTAYKPLTLIKVENTGAFLSFGEAMPEGVKFVLLSLLPLLVLAYGLYHLLMHAHVGKAYAIGLCFVIGGGAGNLYDRLLHGSVTDFMHLDFGLVQTGVFNMADVSIMVGLFLLFIHIYWNRNAIKNKKKDDVEGVDLV